MALSPLYDSLSTRMYSELSGKMGAAIGTHTNLTTVDLDALVDEGRACDIGEQQARNTVADLADRINTAVAELPAGGLDDRAVESVTAIIAVRARRLLAGQPMGAAPPGAPLRPPRRGATTLDAATRLRTRTPTVPRSVSKGGPAGGQVTV